MNKYIGYYRQNKQYEHEKDTIGLIICRYAGKEEARYALDGLEKKIFIAKYQAKLPSESKITRAVQLSTVGTDCSWRTDSILKAITNPPKQKNGLRNFLSPFMNHD